MGPTGATGPGNTIQTGSGTVVTVPQSTDYIAPSTGTAPTVTVGGAHTVLLTITATCTTADVQSGCYMSFTASGGATLAGDDTRAAGIAKNSAASGGPSFTGSASFVVTTTGTTTFTGVYKSTVDGSVFNASSIIAQVYP